MFICFINNFNTIKYKIFDNFNVNYIVLNR